MYSYGKGRPGWPMRAENAQPYIILHRKQHEMIIAYVCALYFPFLSNQNQQILKTLV